MIRWIKRLRYEVRKLMSGVIRAWLRLCSTGGRDGLADAALRFRITAQEVGRQCAARRSPAVEPPLKSCDGTQILTRSVLEKKAPWSGCVPPPCRIPGMLTDAERQYYTYLPQFYSGVGAAVELGPWLGLSTFYLLHGLRTNPCFAGRKLHVFDDFTWRSSWMDKWVEGTELVPPANHDSFLPMFREQTEEIQNSMECCRCKIADYDGNESLPSLKWSGEPIEFLIVDCGRPLAVNEAWYAEMSPSFIPDKTLVVMQDWQNYKRVPEMPWENTKLFTDGKQGALELIHEVDRAGIATFLFRKKGAFG